MICFRYFILFVLTFFLKYSKAQQIGYEGKLLGNGAFILKNLDNEKHRVKAYAVSVLDDNFQIINGLRYFNTSDTLQKSDFNTIVWSKIPKGK